MFDLSVHPTASLLTQVTTWADCNDFNSVHDVAEILRMFWYGTVVDFSACLQNILDDIWANHNQQLDAWQ